jgi:hypothetical protein
MGSQLRINDMDVEGVTVPGAASEVALFSVASRLGALQSARLHRVKGVARRT